MTRDIELTAWEEFEDGSDELLRVNVEYDEEWLDGEDGKMGRSIEILGATYQDDNDNECKYNNIKVNEEAWIERILDLT